MEYDYEAENFKPCPVCQKVIDYHVDGFYHDEILNVWICRDHELAEISEVILLQDTKLIDFIKDREIPLVCATCAGKEPPTELPDFTIIELKACVKCGLPTARELGGVEE